MWDSPNSAGIITPLQALADFCLTQRERGLHPEVQRAAVRAVVDWAAAALAGARDDVSQRLTRAVTGPVSSGKVRLLTAPTTTDVRTAALVNGTAAHASEIDDIYRDGLYHPGAPTIAAALAVAEHRGSSGADFLRAVAVGYEVGSRVARAVNPGHYRSWHTTGTCGAIGAAAAAAELMGLETPAFTHALATATTMTAGFQQAFRSDSMSKPLHSGRAAEAGVLAALAAEQGITGAADVLDGPAGFAIATSGSPLGDDLLTGIGDPWCISQTTVKNHFCCGHTFAAIDASLELRAAGVRAEDVTEITIDTYSTAIDVAGNKSPATAFEAKFSIPYCVASGLIRGSVRLDAFGEPALTDPETRRLVESTALRVDERFDAAYPGQRGACVAMTDRRGDVHVAQRDTRKGDPDDPLTDQELDAKFNEVIEPMLGRSRAASLIAQLRQLPTIDDVGSLDLGSGGERAHA